MTTTDAATLPEGIQKPYYVSDYRIESDGTICLTLNAKAFSQDALKAPIYNKFQIPSFGFKKVEMTFGDISIADMQMNNALQTYESGNIVYIERNRSGKGRSEVVDRVSFRLYDKSGKITVWSAFVSDFEKSLTSFIDKLSQRHNSGQAAANPNAGSQTAPAAGDGAPAPVIHSGGAVMDPKAAQNYLC